MFLTLPFRCLYKGRHAAMFDSMPLALGQCTEVRLYFVTDNGKPLYEWVKVASVQPIPQDEHTFPSLRQSKPSDQAPSVDTGPTASYDPQMPSDAYDEQAWPV